MSRKASTDFTVETKRFLISIFKSGSMRISIDTKEDSHDEIRKVIGMLQNIVGDSQPIFSNQPISSEASQAASSATASPFANIFGDTSSVAESPSAPVETTPQDKTNQPTAGEKEETSQSTEDLFAELFSEEELKKMEPAREPENEDEEEEIKSKAKSKKPDIEFY